MTNFLHNYGSSPDSYDEQIGCAFSFNEQNAVITVCTHLKWKEMMKLIGLFENEEAVIV
jgi:hypothetical protein